MEVVCCDPKDAFVELTKHLVESDFETCVHVKYSFDKNTHENSELQRAFDAVFKDRFKWKLSRNLPWRLWLLESGFPHILYKENDGDLNRMMADNRLITYNFSSCDTAHSFFGHICRPLSTCGGKSYVEYLLERWAEPVKRVQPFFYFDLEPMEWIWNELITNVNAIKTYRSGGICCTNMFFRWDRRRNIPIHGWILKHCQWSHMYQDIYSPLYILRAVLKELGMDCTGEISVFFVSISLDERRKAKELLNIMEV